MNRQYIRINVSIILSILVIFSIVGCGMKIPVKEMSLAHYNITRAGEVKAEKYAPDEYKKAQEKLYQSHQLLKDEKDSDAQKAAAESLEQAKKAIEKSLPPLAQDTLTEAKQKYDTATGLYAEELATDEYNKASEQIKTAETLFNENKYWDSYQESLSAIASAQAAINIARQNIPRLEEKIASLTGQADQLAKNRGDDFAATELALARQHIGDATTSLKNDNIKETLPHITEAEKALEIAKLKTEKGRALESLDAARSAYREASQHENAASIKEKLAAASALIASAEELLQQENYTGSSDKSQEALTILNGALIAMEKETGEEKEKDLLPTEKGEESLKEYVVKYQPGKRDCLWRIAQKVYDNARLWPYIYIANRDQIKDPDLIYPGQKFIIPEIPDKEKKEQVKKEETEKEKEPEKRDETTDRDEAAEKPEDIEDVTDNETPGT